MSGKGDTFRPVDTKSYGENYNRIFRKMDEESLFEIGESLSPRLAWMREKGIVCHVVDGAWMCYRSGNQASGKGITAEEACLKLAEKLKIKIWKQ